MLSNVENKIQLLSGKSNADLTDKERKQRQAAREAADPATSVAHARNRVAQE
jgi:hypothetical protein